MISWNDFEKIDLRAGTIVEVEDFPEARRPSYKLWVDFGEEIGIKKTSAQITKLYTKAQLMNRQVICVTNFAPRQIGKFMSEVLITGFPNASGEVILASIDKEVPNGVKLF
ncbi:MAG: tRNA-binding protein [Bacteroidota bacterium]|jgi:tRNA-binding protein|nr:tRNA-binding protein [Bacteroidota bacterium]